MTNHTLALISCILIACVAICFTSASAQPEKNLSQSRNVKIQETAPGTLQIRQTFPPRLAYKTTAEASSGLTPAADLTIDLSAVDTTAFAGMYRFWMEVPAWYQGTEIVVADANHNNRKEIYGVYRDYDTPGWGYSQIREFDGGSGFTLIHQYADSLDGAQVAADFDGDGLLDVVYWCKHSFIVETQSERDSLPTVEKFKYDFGGQATYIKAYDINGDGRPELIYTMIDYHTGSPDYPRDATYVEGYDSTTNSFRVLYCNKPQVDGSGGLAVGDFDQDGKQNFAVGSINGMLYIYEHQGADSFSVQSLGYVGVDNAFLLGFTHDMDGNGKPELWVGGDTYVNGVGVTRLFVFEATGDDTYQVVYTIDIIGVFSFYAGNMVAADFDHDGKEELLLCIDQHVLIFKSNGIRSYYLWYMRTNELDDAGLNSVIYEASMADFDNDGYPEILVCMDQMKNTGAIRMFTQVYKYQKTASVGPGARQLPAAYELQQNYPNPFNPSTIIQFSIGKSEVVDLRIFDILGREVATLVNERESPGSYSVTFDGSHLASGVYFYRLVAGSFTETKRLLLIR